MTDSKFDVMGMTCSACSAAVEKSVAKLDGVNDVNVNLLTNSMQVDFDEQKVGSEQILYAVENAGYQAQLIGNKAINKSTKEHTAKKDNAYNLKRRFIVSLCFMVPLMYISMHQMFFNLFGLPIPGFIEAAFSGTANAYTFAFTQFILLLPIIIINKAYFIGGFKSLIKRNPNMDSLIGLGSAAATIYGIFTIYRLGYAFGQSDIALIEVLSGDIYFESAAMILTLITLGKWLEAKSKGKTSEAISKLMDLSPQMATLEREQGEVVVPIEDVVLGDIVIVKPGDTVPVDGVVVFGSSTLDEAAITGESIPVFKQENDKVVAATINKTGYLKVKAEKVGENTTISQIIKLVEEASSSKAPIARMADKVAGIFVPVVIIIALVSVVVWLIVGATFEFALSIGIAVLVISCPCALGLATPVAIMVGTGKGAQNGILIKSGEALENAQGIDTVVLDKTGTITAGRPEVTDIMSINVDESKLLQIAYSMEKQSGHPLAEAIVDYAKAHNIEVIETKDFQAIHGKGIEAKIEDKLHLAGNELLLDERGIDLSKIQDKLTELTAAGKTPLIFTDDKQVLGIIAVADTIKVNSREAVEGFKGLGIDVIMLTGDNQRTANAIAAQVGIDKVMADVLPGEKEKVVSQLIDQGKKVAMVGDGINDAPALARADVSVAIGAGTDIAIESADIVLIKSDLLDAVTAVRLSKAVLRNIKQNLFWAFFYNTIGIPLAAGVLYSSLGLTLSPMFAAAAMSLSSISVVLNALRLKLFSIRKEDKDVRGEEMQNNMSEINTIEISIGGMSCEHCQRRVEQALNVLEAVEAKVDLANNLAYVTTNKQVSDEELTKAIEDAGYQVQSIKR